MWDLDNQNDQETVNFTVVCYYIVGLEMGLFSLPIKMRFLMTMLLNHSKFIVFESKHFLLSPHLRGDVSLTSLCRRLDVYNLEAFISFFWFPLVFRVACLMSTTNKYISVPYNLLAPC